MKQTEFKEFRPAGTVLYGKAMKAQLASELVHLGVKNPVVVTDPSSMKAAARAARHLLPGFMPSIRVTAGNPPPESDFLILAGGKSLALRFAADPRPRALVPLSGMQLSGVNEPVSDILVIDTLFIKNKAHIEGFFRTYAASMTGGMAVHPVRMTIPGAFSYSCRTSVLSGHGSLSALPPLLMEKGVCRPLILTDKGIAAAGLLEKLLEELGEGDYEVFDAIPPDSNSRIVNEISALYREKNRDGLIALGGGSVLDTGKGVYLNVSVGADDLSEWAGSGRIPRLHTPFFTIPTTSGTGSEVTKAAVIADEKQGRKILYISPHLQPDYGILDSSLTLSLPPFLTSITGMDALSHAVEAYTCIGKNPLSDHMAWTAIELIRDHLIPAVEDPSNREHRLQLALASSLAGQAFSNSMVGMVHTIGHSVGAVCHVPHGSCMSILLPHALEYNFSLIEPLLAELYPALAGHDRALNSAEEDKARLSIQIIREMNSTLREKTGGRHPENFSQVLNREGEALVQKEDFPLIARTALGDASIVYNPEELGYKDIMDVLEKSY